MAFIIPADIKTCLVWLRRIYSFASVFPVWARQDQRIRVGSVL